VSREQWLQRAGSRWGRLVLWFAAFALMGVVEALQMRAGQRLEDFTITWATALRRGFEMWIPSGILGLGVVWLARRFPFDRERWLRWAGLHLVLSLAYVVVFAVIHAGLLHGQRSVRGPILEFDTLVRKVVVFYSVTNIGFYWLLLVAHEGWVYFQRYRERERRATELESQLARARLEALRLQLNPHFLFNTLNTVAALVHSEPRTSERMVTRLSELLRASLDLPGSQEVPLREELAMLEKYLDIEQVRFGDRLQVRLDVPAETLDLLVPSLVLQPVVENAVRHGIEPLESDGRVEVVARVHDGTLVLTVRDNGPGPSAETRDGSRRGGIGLANTRARLAHLYGDRHALRFAPAPGGGTEVVIEIPTDPLPSGATAASRPDSGAMTAGEGI